MGYKGDNAYDTEMYCCPFLPLEENNMANFTPDAKKHLIISLVKSAIRIMAGVALATTAIVPIQFAGIDLIVAGSAFVVAEILGVVEELV